MSLQEKHLGMGATKIKEDLFGKNLSVGGNSFLVRVQFRQNASWQGTVQWLEEKRTCNFRSLLELLLLIQETLDKTEDKALDDFEFRTWHEKEEVS